MTGPVWRIELADLLTDRKLADVDATNVSFDRLIGKPGSFSGTVAVPDPGTADLLRPCEPQRTALYVYRGERDIWWGGILWGRRIVRNPRGAHELHLTAAGFESYLYRIVPEFFGVPSSLGDHDQLDIARGLLAEGQMWGSDLGITADATMSGVMRHFGPYPGERDPFTGTFNSGTSYGKALDNLADRIDGFEYTIDTFHDAAGIRRRHMRFGYPRLGNLNIRHDLTDPGNILTWEWDEDGVRGATDVLVRGGQVPRNSEMVPASDYFSFDDPPDYPPPEITWAADLLDAGWPVVTMVVDDSNLTTREQLRPRIRAERTRLTGAVQTPSVTVRLSETDITPTHLGDTARIHIDDVWWNPPLVADRRMIGCRVRPPLRGQAEAIDVFLEGTDVPAAA